MIKMYNTKLFSEIWDSASDFSDEYKSSELYTAPSYAYENGQYVMKSDNNSLEDSNITKLYYLLYARYGNNPITNLDETQFKYKVFSIIFEYGPNWQRELGLQNYLRNMSEADLQAGSFAIYNQAAHDATAPGTSTTQELQYINNQNTSRIKKGKLNAYNELLLLLKRDVTKEFIDRFAICFKKFLFTRPTLYVTEIEEEGEENDD